MKNTNSKEYKQAIKQYLMDCLESSESSIEYFFQCFESEYNLEHNKRRLPNYQNRLAEYLSGLPSCINIDFSNHDIIKAAEQLHDCTLTDKQQDKVINFWFNHLAFHLIKLNNGK
jgi:hypothetical protein